MRCKSGQRLMQPMKIMAPHSLNVSGAPMDLISTICVMPTVDHRGFDPLPTSIISIPLDASLKSDLVWKITSDSPHILWKLDFDFKTLNPTLLSSYQLAIRIFVQTIWEKHKENTLGVILYKDAVPSFELKEFSDYLHHIAAGLPDEVPPFAFFNCVGDPLLFSKEIFPHIHLGFRSGPIGALHWGKTLIPRRYDGKLGVVLPLRARGLQFDEVDICLKELEKIPYRLINEPCLTEEWDGLDEIIVFEKLISPRGMRMIQGFEAAGGKVKNFGVEGFEPPAFCSQSRHASQAALYPEKD